MGVPTFAEKRMLAGGRLPSLHPHDTSNASQQHASSLDAEMTDVADEVESIHSSAPAFTSPTPMSAEAPPFTPAQPTTPSVPSQRATMPVPPHRAAMSGPHRRPAAPPSAQDASGNQVIAPGLSTLSVRQTRGPHSRPVNTVAASLKSASASDSTATSPSSDASRVHRPVIAPSHTGASAGTEMPAVRDASVVQPNDSSEKSMEQKTFHEDPFTAQSKNKEDLATVSSHVGAVEEPHLPDNTDGTARRYTRGEWLPMLLELKHLPEVRRVIEAYSDHIHSEVVNWKPEDKIADPSERIGVNMVMPRGQSVMAKVSGNMTIKMVTKRFASMAMTGEDKCVVNLSVVDGEDN